MKIGPLADGASRAAIPRSCGCAATHRQSSVVPDPSAPTTMMEGVATPVI